MTDKMAKAKVIEMIYSECAEMMINKENSKRNLVSEWRQKNPNRTQYACWKETGISRITVKKWWNSDEEYENEKIKFKTRLNELVKCESAADDESWHIISWNYISENRYTESNKAQTYEIRAGRLKDCLNGKVKYNMESFSTQIKKSINGDEYYSTPP